ncbi:MAG: DNA-3-methyladenine glycosylase I [Mycobacterium sp.]|nr:DNA-3-methyladenine glycosylase I [Mycobacterium sp.]
MSVDTGPGESAETVPDDRTRCDWARAGLLRDYHDTEWGRALRGTTALFERLALESFQSGLSWLIILRKRDAFRRAFAGFDVATVAAFTEGDVERLMGDAGIVRNRAKIEATITNARAVAALDVDLSDLLWSFAPPRRSRPASTADLPSSSPQSAAMAAELRRRGFRFVGPTTAYALMQATGMVDDHLEGCWVPPADSSGTAPRCGLPESAPGSSGGGAGAS